MASVRILVQHVESGNYALMEISEQEVENHNVTPASLKENGYAIVDNHEDALHRLYAEAKRGRPYQGIRAFAPAAAFLRIR
jgi:hypothetical protein